MRAHVAQYKHAVGYIDLMLCGRGPAQVSHCGVSGINSFFMDSLHCMVRQSGNQMTSALALA